MHPFRDIIHGISNAPLLMKSLKSHLLDVLTGMAILAKRKADEEPLFQLENWASSDPVTGDSKNRDTILGPYITCMLYNSVFF